MISVAVFFLILRTLSILKPVTKGKVSSQKIVKVLKYLIKYLIQICAMCKTFKDIKIQNINLKKKLPLFTRWFCGGFLQYCDLPHIVTTSVVTSGVQQKWFAGGGAPTGRSAYGKPLPVVCVISPSGLGCDG